MDESIESGQVGQRLHELDRLRQDRRLVGERDAGVDVEHVRAGLDLGDRVALDPREVTGLHLLGEELATGRVDALADDHERLVVADDDLAGRGADDGVGGAGHAGSTTSSAGPGRGRLARRLVMGRRERRATLDAAGGDEQRQAMLVVLGLEPLDFGRDLGVDRPHCTRARSCATPRCSRRRSACRRGSPPCRWRPGSAGGGRSCWTCVRHGPSPGPGCPATR